MLPFISAFCLTSVLSYLRNFVGDTLTDRYFSDLASDCRALRLPDPMVSTSPSSKTFSSVVFPRTARPSVCGLAYLRPCARSVVLLGLLNLIILHVMAGVKDVT